MTTPPPTRWQAPGRAPSAGPALVAGITAALLPVVVTTVLAWWLARSARREIAASGGQLVGGGHAIWAYVLAGYSVLATAGLVASALG